MKQKCWSNGKFRGVEDKTEVRIYFRPKEFIIFEHEVEMTVYTLVYSGHCTGAELRRLSNGEVRVYFNPAYHSRKDRKKTIRQMMEVIGAQSIEIKEEE